MEPPQYGAVHAPPGLQGRRHSAHREWRHGQWQLHEAGGQAGRRALRGCPGVQQGGGGTRRPQPSHPPEGSEGAGKEGGRACTPCLPPPSLHDAETRHSHALPPPRSDPSEPASTLHPPTQHGAHAGEARREASPPDVSRQPPISCGSLVSSRGQWSAAHSCGGLMSPSTTHAACRGAAELPLPPKGGGEGPCMGWGQCSV